MSAENSVPAGVFVHARALCESVHVGEKTRVWAFAHVLPGARIGTDCNICDHVFIENDVVLGDRVTVKCAVQLLSESFWRVYRRFVVPEMPRGGTDVFGCTSEVRDRLLPLQESDTNLIALLPSRKQWIGADGSSWSPSR